MAIAFVDCTLDQLPPLQTFFAEMYWPEYVLAADRQFLQWQFGQVPGGTRDFHMILSTVDGQIRGCIGYIPLEITVGGRTVAGAWAANWMVDERQRRLGLGPLLMRELCKRFEVILATGPSDEAADLLARMGWTDFGDLMRWVSVLDAGAGALTESGAIDWPHGVTSARRLEGIAVTRVPRFNNEATACWDALCGSALSGTRRSAAFLNWRYASHPSFDHRLFEARAGGRLNGFGVYRVEQVRDMATRVGRIVELLGDAASVDAVLHGIEQDARNAGAVVLDFFCSTARMEPVLASRGFLRAGVPPASLIPMLFQPLDRRRAGIRFMADLRRVPADVGSREWYATKSDGDQDRPGSVVDVAQASTQD